MTDSPAFRAPLDPNEQPILDKCLSIRDSLLLLKQDKTQYVRSQDVNAYYNQVIEQVEALNKIRTHKREEQNRLDTVLDDCFQLISLFFLTVGRNNEAPAAYALVSTIKRLLEHLKEAGFFARKDLLGISRRIEIIEESIEEGRSIHSPDLLLLLEARIATCRSYLAELHHLLAQLSPDLAPTHEKLVSILRTLSGLNTRAKFPDAEVQQLRQQLFDIQEQVEGTRNDYNSEDKSVDEHLNKYAEKIKALNYDMASTIPAEEVVRDLIERCLLWSGICLQRRGQIDERFKDQYDVMVDIRNKLDKLSLTQAWSLRETDLYGYQRKLDRFDEARIDGDFIDAHGEHAGLYENRTLLYLMRKSYASIFFMLTSSEPVSEALLPIYNQLTTLKKCLVEVKNSGGVASPRELYPYSMKLNSLDQMRKDGKFIVNGDVPEGQGPVTTLLQECFDMAFELRNDASGESGKKDVPKGGDDSAQGKAAAVRMTLPATSPPANSIGVN